MIFPTDMYSLIKLGGYNFLEKEPKWPIQDEKFDKVIKKFHDHFFYISEKQEEFVKQILYVDFTFIYFLSYKLHFDIIKKSKIKIVKGNSSKIFIDDNIKNYLDPFTSNIITSEKKYILLLKYYIKNFLKFNFFSFKKKYLCVGGDSNLVKKYTKQKNISYIYSYSGLIIKPSNSQEFVSMYTKILSPLFYNLEKNIKKVFKINIDTKDYLNVFANRYSILHSTMIESLKNKIEKYNGVLAKDNYKTPTRFIGLYYRLINKDSICFDHGNQANGRNNHQLLTSQLLSYNKFVTISKKSKNSIIRLVKSSKIFKSLKNIHFDYVNDGFLETIYKNRSKYRIKKSKNILIMGWPMNPRKYFDEGPYSFFYNKIILEIQIIKFLKKKGFNVYYKSHPERSYGIKKIFSKLVDGIFFNKIETNKDLSFIDTFIFTSTCSSSFGYSLCTNKKIILLYKENYLQDHLKLLSKRVSLLPMNFNLKKNFDYNHLLKILNNSNYRYSYDYVLNYLF